MTTTGKLRGLGSLPRRTITGVAQAPQQVRKAWQGLEEAGTVALDVVQNPQALLDRIHATLDEITALAEDVRRLTDAVSASVAAVAVVSAEVERTRAQAATEIRRTELLLDLYDEPLAALAPVIAEASTSLSPQQIRLVGQLLDLIPDEAERVQPAVKNLVALAPDLEELIERLNSVGEVVEGIPGAGLLRRRTQAAEEKDEKSDSLDE